MILSILSFPGPDTHPLVRLYAMQTQSQTPNNDSKTTGALGRAVAPSVALPPPPAPADKGTMLEREANALSSCFKASASSIVFE